MIHFFKTVCFLVCVIQITLAAPANVELINDFTACIKSNPNLGECLKTILQSIIPNLVKGVPSIGLPSIDPFHVTSLEIDQGTGPVNIKLNFRDLDVSNIGTVKFNEINADLDKNNFTLDVDFEKPISLDGQYDIKGQVMILPITGNGIGKISLDNVRAKINVQLKTVVKNEDTFVEIQDMSLKFNTSRMHIKLDNLFNGDKALGDNMNTFLNENWKDILGELQSSIENALITFISGIGQQILSKIPLNQVLID